MIDRDKNLYFQHRADRPLRENINTRDDLIKLVDDLLELEAQTHPSAGGCSNKDELSRYASMIAGDLLRDLLGWAVDHQIGLVLNNLPGGAASLFPDVEAKNIKCADDHRHEARATAYVIMGDDLDTDRKMLWALLKALPHSLIPAKFLVQLLPALESLEVGEQSEFFTCKARTHGQERNPYSRWMIRLRAVEHLEFLRGKNVKRENAKYEVAKAYGIEADTLDSWSTKLRQKLKGIVHVGTNKQRARNRGKNALARLQQGDSSLVNREAEALKRDGTIFQELMGASRGRIVPTS